MAAIHLYLLTLLPIAIKSHEMWHIASMYQRYLPASIQNAWKTCTKNLNKLTLPWKFVNIPAIFCSNFIEEVLLLMSNEGYSVAIHFQRSVLKDPRRILLSVVCILGKERVIMRS